VPFAPVLGNIAQLALHVSVNEKVPCRAVAAHFIGEKWLYHVLRAVSTTVASTFVAAEAHTVFDVVHAQLSRADEGLVLAAKSWAGDAVAAVCCAPHICAVVVEQ
jgi:hypothetical protein